MVKLLGAAAALAWALAAGAAEYHVYVGQLGPRSALVAWGTTAGGGETIGRGSRPLGKAELRIGEHTIETERNWAEATGLEPDTEYEYEVRVGEDKIGEGRLRTWPEVADRLTFFVIGDFGNGTSGQYRIAEAMWKEFQRHEDGDSPVRFVLTTGDNIYADVNLGYVILGSGSDDSHWGPKFFRPYEELLRRVPFLPTLGNHDGNSTESRSDLAQYLDNFFFPGNRPARWYSFSYGGLADFFALDTTNSSSSGPRRAAYTRGGEQFGWLREALPASRAPWKIPYFHHPPFNAGPGHGSSLPGLEHFVELFRDAGVAVVFNGHEHNLQFSERNFATGGVQYVITGAGGELRSSPVRRMAAAHIAGWAPQRHFLRVEIEGAAMRITPIGYQQIVVRDSRGAEVEMPLVVTLPQPATVPAPSASSGERLKTRHGPD